MSVTKPATIRTVADQAGVSIATVSRVVNNPAVVAEDTRRRVLDAIREQGFRISREAQLTRRSSRPLRTGRIGFLAQDIPQRAADSITEEMGKGIQQVLLARGLELVAQYYPFAPGNIPKIILEDSVDGILLRPPYDRQRVHEFCRSQKTVLLASSFTDMDLPCVLTDDWAGMRQLLDYLYGLGHRRIGFLGCTTQLTINHRRLHAYRAYLDDKRMPQDAALVKIHDAPYVREEEMKTLAPQILHELLTGGPTPPTAVVTSMDGLAAGLLRAAKEMKIRVPDDLSIAGYGDQYYAPYTEPPLTTLRVDYRAIGEIGATQLLQMIEGETAATQTLVKPTFIERGSCGSPR